MFHVNEKIDTILYNLGHSLYNIFLIKSKCVYTGRSVLSQQIIMLTIIIVSYMVSHKLLQYYRETFEQG